MMSRRERVEALKALGYTSREADFLCLAALHSGYFLRRQYNRFLGQSRGRPDDRLAHKVVRYGHAHLYPASRKVQLFHLASRPFYAAIGEENNRNRRRRPVLSIKTKLMALDYVLEHPGRQYLATEAEKVDFFTRRLAIAPNKLPVKIYRSRTSHSTTQRYFVDKFPLFLDGSEADPPVVAFCYIDEGIFSAPGFETWLSQYAGLLRALDRARIVYVANRDRNLRLAQMAFDRFFRSCAQGPESPAKRLAEYFELEDLYLRKQFDRMDAGHLDRLRTLRKTYSNDRYRDLFERWRKDREAPGGHMPLDRASSDLTTRCAFSTYRLDYNYDFFVPVSGNENDEIQADRQ
jgi:hypothetical protein